MQPGLRERERGPDRAYPSSGTRSPHGRGRRKADTTHITGRGESHREVVPAHQGPGIGRRYLPRSQARSQRLRHFPSQWKLADVAMIPKPGQSPTGRKTTGPSVFFRS
ncbi:hypothetical protein Trydic_g13934 [Trypoxylus dichotomus]